MYYRNFLISYISVTLDSVKFKIYNNKKKIKFA